MWVTGDKNKKKQNTEKKKKKTTNILKKKIQKEEKNATAILKVRDEDEGDRGANESVGSSHPYVRPHPR